MNAKKHLAVIILIGIIITFVGCEPWDEGFNKEWVGSYKSSSSADYAVVLKISEDGNYSFSYGEVVVTT